MFQQQHVRVRGPVTRPINTIYTENKERKRQVIISLLDSFIVAIIGNPLITLLITRVRTDREIRVVM
jgi:hypothetical protein